MGALTQPHAHLAQHFDGFLVFDPFGDGYDPKISRHLLYTAQDRSHALLSGDATNQRTFQLDEEGWSKLPWRWGFFFLTLAVVNEIVWRNFSEAFWVGFKFWGMTGLTMAFVASQLPMMMRHSPDEPSDET